ATLCLPFTASAPTHFFTLSLHDALPISLFFEGFAKPELARSPNTRALLGKIRYLNGGLFLPHRVELNHGFLDIPRIKIPDVAFRSEEHTSELQSPDHLVCRLLLEKKKH